MGFEFESLPQDYIKNSWDKTPFDGEVEIFLIISSNKKETIEE
jgi:hypothetical protein